MTGRPPDAGVDLLGDSGLLLPGALLEIGGWHLAAAVAGSAAVLPWRHDWRQATAAGVSAVGTVAELPATAWSQVVVRVDRGRAPTQERLHAAWQALAPGGRLAIEGPNGLGTQTWIDRLEDWCGGAPLVASVRARHRAAAFLRTAAAGPPPAQAATVPAEASADAPGLSVPPGGFAHGALDGGTALLIAQLDGQVPATRILDLGCGAGHLAIAALRRWPSAQAACLDADARAARGCAANLADLGLAARATAAWWDDADPLPAGPCDLVLCNPPAHAGDGVDLGAARRLCRCAAAALAPGGRLLLVANRRLPYEASLASLGFDITQLAQTGGYKVLLGVTAQDAGRRTQDPT